MLIDLTEFYRSPKSTATLIFRPQRIQENYFLKLNWFWKIVMFSVRYLIQKVSVLTTFW